jgi:hypothetical protein
MTMEEIDNIRSIILRGIQLSGQMSYSRRAANEKAMPLLQQALSTLKAIVENGQADYEVFSLLALTHENSWTIARPFKQSRSASIVPQVQKKTT